jgi:hypothetical protein
MQQKVWFGWLVSELMRDANEQKGEVIILNLNEPPMCLKAYLFRAPLRLIFASRAFLMIRSHSTTSFDGNSGVE